MKNKTAKLETNLIEQVNDFFEDNEEIHLTEINQKTLMFLIIHCLDQCIIDTEGNKAQFTMTQDTIFMKLDSINFSIALRDNNKYQ